MALKQLPTRRWRNRAQKTTCNPSNGHVTHDAVGFLDTNSLCPCCGLVPFSTVLALLLLHIPHNVTGNILAPSVTRVQSVIRVSRVMLIGKLRRRTSSLTRERALSCRHAWTKRGTDRCRWDLNMTIKPYRSASKKIGLNTQGRCNAGQGRTSARETNRSTTAKVNHDAAKQPLYKDVTWLTTSDRTLALSPKTHTHTHTHTIAQS